MPDFSAPVAAGVTGGADQGIRTLSNLMGLKEQQQRIQSGAIGISQQQQNLKTGEAVQQRAQAEAQAGQQAMQERLGIQQMMQSGKDDQGNDIRNANGEPDPAKVLPALGRMAPLTGQAVAQSILATHTAKVGLQSAATGLDSTQRQALMGPIQAIATNPGDPGMVDKASTALEQWGEAHPEMGATIGNAKTLLDHIKNAPTTEARAHLANSLAALMQPGQAVQTQPQAISINTGRAVEQGVQQPAVAGGGVTLSTGVPLRQPPGTATWTDPRTGNTYAFDPENPGKTILVGHGESLRPGGASAAAQAPTSAPNATPTPAAVSEQRRLMEEELAKEKDPSNRAAIQREIDRLGGGSAPPVMNVGEAAAQAAGRTATAADMTSHFSSMNANAERMPLVNSLTKTIESLAPEAFVGPGHDKRQYWAGLARVFGINLTGDTQTDTNLLQKAMAQLNISSPAGTDAARLLVEAGQPNTKMDSDAIKEAAGTLRGQVKMINAERDWLGELRYKNGGAGDPAAYQQKRQFFESNADPRIWQYEDLRKSDRKQAKKFIQRQPDSGTLADKADALEKAGFFGK